MATEIVDNLYDTIRKLDTNQQNVDDKVQRYETILKMQMELEKIRKQIESELDDSEREVAYKDLSEGKSYDIQGNDNLSVKDVAKILEVTPQMVRRYCKNGQINASQRMEDSGKWFIPTSQFLNHPNFKKYIERKERQKKQSLNIANKMLQYLEEDED